MKYIENKTYKKYTKAAEKEFLDGLGGYATKRYKKKHLIETINGTLLIIALFSCCALCSWLVFAADTESADIFKYIIYC